VVSAKLVLRNGADSTGRPGHSNIPARGHFSAAERVGGYTPRRFLEFALAAQKASVVQHVRLDYDYNAIAANAKLTF